MTTLDSLYNLQSFFLCGHVYHKVLKLANCPENRELKLLHATFYNKAKRNVTDMQKPAKFLIYLRASLLLLLLKSHNQHKYTKK